MRAPPHSGSLGKPCGSALECRVELRPARHRRTLRRNTGRIRYVSYATFSFPTHTRMASMPKSPAPAVATLFGLPATLRAWTESLLSTRQQVTGSGLMGEADALGESNAAPPLPPPFGRPKRNGLRAESDQGLQVFGPVRTPPFSRTRLVAGEPPDPVPLGRELQASGGRAAATRRPGRPQLQARVQPFPHSCHEKCGGIFRASPGHALPPSPKASAWHALRFARGLSIDPCRRSASGGIVPASPEALSASTIAAPIAAAGADPAEAAGIGCSRLKGRKTKPQDHREPAICP